MEDDALLQNKDFTYALFDSFPFSSAFAANGRIRKKKTSSLLVFSSAFVLGFFREFPFSFLVQALIAGAFACFLGRRAPHGAARSELTSDVPYFPLSPFLPWGWPEPSRRSVRLWSKSPHSRHRKILICEEATDSSIAHLQKGQGAVAIGFLEGSALSFTTYLYTEF